MSMIRHPVVYTGVPPHNRLPPLGRAFWYKLRNSAEQRGMDGIPSLTKTLVAGSVSANEYTDPTMYQFPNDNGNTSEVQWVATENEETLYLDSVCTLVDMVAGEQIIVACDLAYVEQASENGQFWALGTASAAGHIGFGIQSGESPLVSYRPRTTSGGSNTTKQLTPISGNIFADFKAQGRFTVVTSIRVIDATHIAVEMLIGNGTLTGYYSYDEGGAGIDVRGAGTDNPGFSGQTIANFRGLSIGCMATADSGGTNIWGRGATNVGRYDQIVGWRGAYDADLLAAVLEDMAVTNRLDYPPALCAAP